MLTVKLRVYGRVQGVGFRYFTKLLADRLQVNGTVENKIDGSVLVYAQGEDEIVQKFIEAVKQSPAPMGIVDRYEVQHISNEKKFTNFSIRN